MKATHATGVVNLRPRENRQEIQERLAEVLIAAINDRHRLTHRGSIHQCSDPICEAQSALDTAAWA
ncbi:MAG: hypothetical protein KDB60_12660 [Propionibacteriaceae bacterium]|nr:hypothetical protein [Propionibacteriaceae bacterium]